MNRKTGIDRGISTICFAVEIFKREILKTKSQHRRCKIDLVLAFEKLALRFIIFPGVSVIAGVGASA